VQKRTLTSFSFWYFVFFTLLLYLPIFLLVVFSFNDAATLTFPLKGFTLRWYERLLAADELLRSVWNSIVLGVASSLVATILGTMAAIGVVKYRFPGRGLFVAVAAMPLVIPYVVLGVAMLIAFSQVNIPLSLWTVGIGHVIINIPLVLLIVGARLIGMEPNLEEAAMDLGATYWGTQFRVTLPIAFPAMVAAFLTSFTTSFDEFALAFFLVGPQPTLPVYIYSQLRYPSRLPVVVALAAVIMVASVLLIVFAEWLRRLGQQSARPLPDALEAEADAAALAPLAGEPRTLQAAGGAS
jgi:spermidine/putrescine transport system permease protein